ncbi:MAG: hypothetical protein IH888_11310 [Planctomycetes bacterium]|nr:hypothetical protein [Planctomycetota bacterium]
MNLLVGVALLAVFGWLGLRSFGSLYLEKRRTLKAQVEGLDSDLRRFRAAADDHPRVIQAITGYADRTLGGDRETVDHRLRSRLNRIGEEIGLSAVTVGTGRVKSLQTPARSEFRHRARRALGEEIDAVEVEGWISGRGAFEQALRLIYMIREEPWLKRVTHVRLQPTDGGKRFAVTLRLTTLFLPDQEPQTPLEATDDPAADEGAVAAVGGFETYRSLIARDPFRLPSAAPTPEPKPKPKPVQPASAQPPSYSRWVLTGVALGPGGAEVWLLKADSGESRRLGVGETFQGLVLVGAAGEVAEFRLGETRFSVTIGQRLAPPGK